MSNFSPILETKERLHTGHTALPVFLSICPKHWLDHQLVVHWLRQPIL